MNVKSTIDSIIAIYFSVFYAVILVAFFLKRESRLKLIQYTILLPLTLIGLSYQKFFSHISLGKIVFFLPVLSLNMFLVFVLLTSFLKIPQTPVLVVGALFLIALCIYATMLEDYKWKLQVKEASLSFLLFLIGEIALVYFILFMSGYFEHNYFPNEIMARLVTVFVVLGSLFLDISLIMMCFDTRKYLFWLKKVTKPENLKDHVPSMAKSVACSILASAVAYTIWGTVATTSASGLVVGAISYVLFGKFGDTAT